MTSSTYFGEANVYQKDLDSFLAIADEIKLMSLTGQTSNELLGSKESQDALMGKDVFTFYKINHWQKRINST